MASIGSTATSAITSGVSNIQGQVAGVVSASALGNSLASTLGANGALGSFGSLSTLLNQQASNSALSKLSSPVFGAGPQDSLAVADVYNVNNSNNINSIQGKLSGFDPSSLGNFRSSSSTGLLGSLTASISGIIPINTGSNIATNLLSVGTRVVASVGGNGSMIGLSTGLQNSVLYGLANGLGAATGVSPTLFSTGIAVIDGQQQQISGGNILSAISAVGLVGTLTGLTTSFIDVGADASVMTAAVSTLIGLGLTMGVAALVNNGESNTVQAALTANIATAVSASDMATIDLLISKLGPGAILEQMPNFATKLLQSYKIPSTSTQANYAALYSDLLNALNTVQPGWSTYSRNGVTTPSLIPFQTASADALKLFATDPTYFAQSQCAGKFPSQVQLTTLQTQYPLMIQL